MTTGIAAIVASLRQSAAVNTPRELAVAIHNHVRDEIPFGFTRQHDKADPSYTLERHVGHCTPKADLFCSMLREAGFDDATMVTVPIPGDILHRLGKGESSPYPSRLQHTFTEVTIEGKKCRVDSYVVDPPLFRAAQEKLKQQVTDAGYGIHSQGSFEWDGKGDSFSQYVPSMHTPELEQRFQSSRQVVAMPGYLHSDLMSLLSIPLIGYYGVGGSLEAQNKYIGALRK